MPEPFRTRSERVRTQTLRPQLQRINGNSLVFSAAVLALLAVSTFEDINILQSTPSILSAYKKMYLGCVGPCRRDFYPIACRPPTFPGAVVDCDSEGPEPIDAYSVRGSIVRYHRRGAHVAGYRGRGARAGCANHVCTSSVQTGTRRSASEYPPHCHLQRCLAEGASARPLSYALGYPIPDHIAYPLL